MRNLVIVSLALAAGLLLLGLGLWVWGAPPNDSQVDRRTPPRWHRLALLALAFGLGDALAWAGWGLWGSGPHSGDRWLSVMTGFGATTAGVGVLAGALLAWRYGRRASLSIKAKAHPVPGGSFLIAARPSVRAVGVFGVRFRATNGSTVRVAEVWVDDT